MTTTRSTAMAKATLTRDLLHAARDYLGNRRGLLSLAGLALLAGMAVNWGWLIAAGIAPVLISVLPCVAMCAVGLCMHRASSKSCSASGSAREPVATMSNDAAPTIQATTLGALPDLPADRLPGNTVAAPLASPEPQPLDKRSTTDA